MFMAAAKTLAMISRAVKNPDGNVLPPVTRLREVAFEVARAVALKAQEELLATDTGEAALNHRIRSKMWTPAYVQYVRTPSAER